MLAWETFAAGVDVFQAVHFGTKVAELSDSQAGDASVSSTLCACSVLDGFSKYFAVQKRMELRGRSLSGHPETCSMLRIS